jgi:hypothetical protein
MEKVSLALEADSDAGNSKTSIRTAAGGKADYVDQVLATLVKERYVSEDARSRPRYRLQREYRQEDDPACPDPVPVARTRHLSRPVPHVPNLSQACPKPVPVSRGQPLVPPVRPPIKGGRDRGVLTCPTNRRKDHA